MSFAVYIELLLFAIVTSMVIFDVLEKYGSHILHHK